jgi:hypothetical protein
MGNAKNWSGIESVSLIDNFVEMGFKFNANGFREYLVSWSVDQDSGQEIYDSESDDNKRLAYSLFYEKQEAMLAL